MNRTRLEELFLASYADELNELERTELNKLLRDDPEARIFAARFLATDALLADELETSSNERSFATQNNRFIRIAWFAAAAAILMLTTITVSLLMPPGEAVAILAGEELQAGRVLTIADQEAKIKFGSGALVAVEAPASLEILGNNAAYLHYGVATVRVPGPIKGFELVTPANKLVDLGTSFGVTVEQSGKTAVTVFEGEVTVGDRIGAEHIFAGHAIRVNRELGKPSEAISYDTTPFLDTWKSSFGIEILQGNVRFAQPEERVSPGEVIDRNSLLLIPEREGVNLPAQMPLNIIEPGTFTVRFYREGSYVPPGESTAKEIALSKAMLVDSFLLQYNPGLPSPTSKDKPFVSEVRFDREVIGIIAQKDLLAEYDSLLAFPEADFSGQIHRGTAQNDEIILSPDRHTIRVAFDIEDGVDQIRVLVESHLIAL